MTRTDVHSPKNLVTEDYEYLWAFDNQAPGRLVNVDMAWWRSITNWPEETEERGTHQCHHCGAHIRYVALLRHVPSGHAIAVGETCLDNRFERATAEFQKLRKAAELDQAQRIKTACAERLAQLDPTIVTALDRETDLTPLLDGAWANDVVADIRRRFWQYGDVSDKQVALIARLLAEAPKKRAERAASDAEPKAEVPEGRYVITGEVLSTKWHDSDFGGSLKMTVKVTTEAGTYRVWGTVPSKMADPARGDVVSIRATVTRSHDDPSFGFFKRPQLV